MSTVRFEVRGKPVTQGSMKAYMPRGARFPIITHSNPKTTEWRNLVALEARRVAPETPWTDPVELELTFRLQRPLNHYRVNGGLRPTAPEHPAGSRDDIDKYARAVLDALSMVFYRDDGQVVRLIARKEYGNAGAVVQVRRIEKAESHG